MNCPCNLCEARFVGCHAKCETYNAWKSEIADQKLRNGVEKNILMNEFRRTEDLRWHNRRRNKR